MKFLIQISAAIVLLLMLPLSMMMTRIGMINDDESLQQENARSFWLGRNP